MVDLYQASLPSQKESVHVMPAQRDVPKAMTRNDYWNFNTASFATCQERLVVISYAYRHG